MLDRFDEVISASVFNSRDLKIQSLGLIEQRAETKRALHSAALRILPSDSLDYSPIEQRFIIGFETLEKAIYERQGRMMRIIARLRLINRALEGNTKASLPQETSHDPSN